jgi:lipopolysaccharide transport system permease protein
MPLGRKFLKSHRALQRFREPEVRNFPSSPYGAWDSLWCNRGLILALTKREIVGRYQGSVLGLLWSFLNPVFLLAVYTFVFSVVFKARWGAGDGGSKAEFALVLFAGILVFNLFSECVNRAPSLILGNPTYVKKVVFPLEILSWVNLGAALFHTLISFIVWLVFSLFVFGAPPLTSLLFPLLLVPLMLMTMGLSWFLASLGVFLRDVSQVVGILTTALMFLTPIFYPITAIPESYRQILYLNPLTAIIDQARDLLIFGKGMAWGSYGLLTLFSAVMAWLGFVWFQKTRKGFADVL